MPSISVSFNAETGQYIANVQGMEAANAKAAESVARTKNAILAANKERVDSAKAAGATQQELDRIQTKSAESLASVTEKSAGRQMAALDMLLAKEKQVAAERAALGNVTAASAGHGVSDRMAASSLVRGLENGNVGIRTVENFITTLPGASAALQTFFSVAGPLAFAAAVAEGVVKAKELYDAAKALPKVIKEGWESANEPLLLSIDNMRKVNDELEIAHQKFLHQPENLLALAIDEDRIKADQLAASARGAAVEIRKMLAENKSGLGNYVLTGAISTGAGADEINGWFSEVTKKQAADRDAKRSGHDTPEAAQQRKNDIAAFIKAKYDESGTAVSTLSSINQNGALTSNINNYAGAHDRFGSLMDTQSESDRNTVDEQQGKRDAQQRQRDTDAKEAARKGSEAARKAAQDKLRAMEVELADQKLQGALTAKQEYAYWQDRIGAFSRGSTEYKAVKDRLKSVAQESERKLDEYKKHVMEERKRADEADPGEQRQIEHANAELAAKLAQQVREGVRTMDTRSDAAIELQALKSRNAAALEEQQIQSQVGKTITEQAAAFRIAELRAKDYGDEMDRLNARAIQIAKAPYHDDEKKEELLGKLGTDAENLNHRRAEEILKQNQANASPETSAAVGAKSALDDLADAAKDSAGQMRQFIGSSLQEVNQAIMHGNFKGAGKSIAGNLEGTLLNKAEGKLLEGFGFGKQGKPTGTAGDPTHVIVANLGSLKAPDITNSLDLHGGMGADALDTIMKMHGVSGGGYGGGAGGVISSFLGMLPGFATGGYVGAGTMAMVGEHGPEPVFFGDQARVMSNSDMRAAVGGGSGGGDIHVDARGSTDPAQTMAMVHAGIAQAMPQIARASAAHYRQDNRRNGPANRR